MTAPTGATPLTGKVALITGASRGIGAAAAHAFARAGAAVALAARDAGALGEVAGAVTAAGGTAIAIPADVTNEDAVAKLVRVATERLGGLHMAFNNAGGFDYARAPLAETPTATFDAVLAANLRGAFLCVKHEIPAMLACGGGAIVNTASVAGLSGGAPGISPYVAAKHGLVGLTRTVALDYADEGIRVNALAVGPTRTGRLAAWTDQEKQAAIRAIPMGRFGRPEEVAAAAVWLCSDEAAFITGVTLPVDGGLLAARPE
jgi:NAD(P)-dependent dehydrogenase (short-subunit alcohol dehydrogenase family)